MIIGNKCDREPKVNKKEAEKFSEKHGIKYIETSAKLDKNIRKAIACLLEEIIKSKEIIESDDKLVKNLSLNDNVVSSTSKRNKNSKKKCGCWIRKNLIFLNDIKKNLVYYIIIIFYIPNILLSNYNSFNHKNFYFINVINKF